MSLRLPTGLVKIGDIDDGKKFDPRTSSRFAKACS
jgi:hypothetical protein